MTLPHPKSIAPSVRRELVTHVATSTATVPNNGVVTIVDSSGNNTLTMKPPKSGCQVAIIATNVGGGTFNLNSDSTGTSFTSTGANRLTFDAANEAVILRGLSTSQWSIVANQGGVGVATRST